MEATKRGNYSGAPCSDTGEFEGALHGLSTAVAKKNTCEALLRKMCKTFKEASTHVIVDNLGTGDEALRLLRDSSSNLWPSMSNIRYAMARSAVDIFAAFSIPQGGTISSYDSYSALTVHAAAVSVLQVNSCDHILI